MPEVSKTRLDEFLQSYGRQRSRAELQVEREVFGTNAGIASFTTPAQADTLATLLELTPESLLLDVGSGTGWPALYLAERSGCRAVLTDVPLTGVRSAAATAASRGLGRRCAVVAASGTRLPLRPRTFDAVVLSDVL